MFMLEQLKTNISTESFLIKQEKKTSGRRILKIITQFEKK